MKVLTDKAARDWLQSHGFRLSETDDVSFDLEKNPPAIPVAAPSSREAVTSLPLNLVGILDSGHDWLLWMRDFDIWSTEIEEIGWELIHVLTDPGQPELALDSRAFLFASNESLRLKAAVLVPLLFMWDAYLVNGDGETFVRIDHDDHNSISTISARVRGEIEGSQLDPNS